MKDSAGTFIDPGSIVLNGSTLELSTRFNGSVTMSLGTNTLVLDVPLNFGITPGSTLSTDLGLAFGIKEILTGDKIVLKGLNSLTEQVVSATLGDVMLKDGVSHLALQIVLKSMPSSPDSNASEIDCCAATPATTKPSAIGFTIWWAILMSPFRLR